MRIVPKLIAAALSLVALAAVLAFAPGLWRETLRAVACASWESLACVLAVQLVGMSICAAALNRITCASYPACWLARGVRDGSSNLLSVIPGAGEMASARALFLLGLSGPVAVLGMMYDLAAETLAQVPYTVLGVVAAWGPHAALGPTAAALAGALAAMAIFAPRLASAARRFARRARIGAGRRFAWGDRLALRLRAAARPPPDGRRMAQACALHLVAWFCGAVQVWIVAMGLPHHLGWRSALGLESVVYAGRAVLFFVPAGIGVHELGFLAVGAALGLPVSEGLAIALMLRARDIVFGFGGLAAWGALEARTGVWSARPGRLRRAAREGARALKA